jgi:uncharacterized protein YfbU (UPF0304 family)
MLQIAIAFKITISSGFCPENKRDFTGYARFFRNADFHVAELYRKFDLLLGGFNIQFPNSKQI